MKCDEGKPACRRCLSTGRTCDGYAAALGDPSPPPATAIIRKSDERPLDFFLNRVAPSLAGFLEDDVFWKHVAGHVTCNDGFLRNAVFAASSIFEQVDTESGDPVPNNDILAVQNYHAAQSNLARSHRPSTREVLVACVIFICLELMRGDIAAAQIHIRQGSKILDDWRGTSVFGDSSAWSSPTPLTPSTSSTNSLDDNTDDLLSIFARLGLQSAFFDPTKISLLPDTPTWSIDASFSSLAEARQQFFEILPAANKLFLSTYLRRYSNDINFEDMCVQAHLQTVLSQFRQCFKTFYTSYQDTWTTRERDAANVLLVQSIVIGIQLGACMSPLECAYDIYRSEFENVIAISSDIVSRNKENLTFHFDMGLIPPLHLVGWKCRYPALRRQLLKILSTKRWREGMFDSYRTFRYAHQIMITEEASGETLPPESARIHFAELGELKPGASRQRLRLGRAPTVEGLFTWDEWIPTHRNLPVVQTWLD